MDLVFANHCRAPTGTGWFFLQCGPWSSVPKHSGCLNCPCRPVLLKSTGPPADAGVYLGVCHSLCSIEKYLDSRATGPAFWGRTSWLDDSSCPCDNRGTDQQKQQTQGRIILFKSTKWIIWNRANPDYDWVHSHGSSHPVTLCLYLLTVACCEIQTSSAEELMYHNAF